MLNVHKLCLIVLLLVRFDPTVASPVSISTSIGDIFGIKDTVTQDGQLYDYTVFSGIPFGESTAGNGRFAKPVKKAPFTQPFNATSPGNYCPQNPTGYPTVNQMPMSEDCLNLNVFVPGTASPSLSLPVMIFIYGGGFQFGSQEPYRAPGFAVTSKVILVTFNYRISAYGFLANSAIGLNGNYGLWDQHLAIQWVHDHISSFGGNPNMVTLFGQSAGAASVIYQAMFKDNEGLFQQIIAISGSATCPWAYETEKNSQRLFSNLTTGLNCSNTDQHDVLRCLRNVHLDDMDAEMESYTFVPVVDGEFLQSTPDQLFSTETAEARSISRRLGNLSMMIGNVNMETAFMLRTSEFALNRNFSDGMTAEDFKSSVPLVVRETQNKDTALISDSILHQYYDWTDPSNTISAGLRYIEMGTDIVFRVPLLVTANAHAASPGTGRTYYYEFTHRPSFSIWYPWVKGASHAEDLAFVFGFPSQLMRAFNLQDAVSKVTAEEVSLSKDIRQRYAAFARTGDPNMAVTQPWQPYSLDRKNYMVFDTGVQTDILRQNLAADAFHFWREFIPQLSSANA